MLRLASLVENHCRVRVDLARAFAAAWIFALIANLPIALAAAQDELEPAAPLRRVAVVQLTRNNIEAIEEIHSEQAEILSVAWPADSSELFCTIYQRGKDVEGVEVRDAETLEVSRKTALGRRIVSFAFNPAQPQAAWVTDQERVEILNLESGDGIYLEDVGRQPNVVFRPDGQVLATGGQAGQVKLWNAATGELKQTIEVCRDRIVVTPVFSPDSRLLAVALPRGKTTVFDAESGEKKYELPPENSTLSCAFDPKSERLITVHSGSKLALWKAESGELILEKEAEEQVPQAARWLDGGELLATVGPGVVTFWNPADLTVLHEINAPRAVIAFSISPDGRRLVLAGRDPNIRGTLLQLWGVPQ